MNLKLGKLPAAPQASDMLFERYAATKVPEVRVGYSHTSLVTLPWGMLGNDTVGDCAIAGPGHEHMLTSAEAKQPCLFTTESILGAYSAITGYNPDDPNTDQGSDVHDVLKYRQKTGLTDAAGKVHRIGAYTALKPGNWKQLLQALNVGPVGVGIQFPDSAMEQFNAGEPWRVVAGSVIEGGHYVPVVAYPHSFAVVVVTWGKLQVMSSGFYEKYCDEAWCILSPEVLTGGKTIDGLDLQQLQADLAAL